MRNQEFIGGNFNLFPRNFLEGYTKGYSQIIH